MCVFFTTLTTLLIISITVVLCTYTVTKRPDAPDIQSLNGIWRLSNANKTIDIEAKVPGGIYSDLMASNKIPNIYLDQNDVALKWVSMDNWTYYREFSVDDIQDKSAYLIFEGLDTKATIFVNNKIIGKTNNMFVRYKFYVSNYLIPGVNHLQVRFKSPVYAALKEFQVEKAQREDQGVPPMCPPSTYNGECHVNHLRKQQASFSWDWGPSFPSCGIWKSVHFSVEDSFTFQEITVSTEKIGNKDWNLTVTGFFEGEINKPDSAVFSLIVNNPDNTSESFFSSKEFYLIGNLKHFNLTHSMIIQDVIEPWWPNQFGKQKLYQLQASLKSRDGHSANLTRKIGFRTIELTEEKVDRGLSFYFKVNGVPIFMKGSNWIPSNILPEISDTPEGKATIFRLLSAAKWANMNMLRVWGGGVYETDYFYELTDRFGILIWHDMMFACAMYPASDKFLERVQHEVVYQVQRLQYHPSIAIWAGNNENELALRQSWYGTERNYHRFKQDYIQLYVRTIGIVIQTLDKSRPYTTSSPSNGLETINEGFVSRDPGSSFYGDVHYYNYFSDAWDPNNYPKPRFASEYGLQSMPNYLTFLNATTNPDQDLAIGSSFLNHRQHHPMGYGPIDQQILEKFPSSEASKTSAQLLKEYIYKSQIVQAMAMKVETEKYRQLRSFELSSGEGLTMGALYWQLNDVWQAPSWSSIDFAGRWKALQYFAKRFFAPILISASLKSYNELNVYVNSDLINDTLGDCIANISLYRWNHFVPPCDPISIKLAIKPGSSQLVTKLDTTKYLQSCNCDKASCFVSLTLMKNDKNLTKLSDNFYLLAYPKEVVGLSNPDFKVQVSKGTGDNEFIVELSAQSIGLFVWLQTTIPGYFEDNGFIMIEPKRTIVFISEVSTSIDVFKTNLFVSSVNDMNNLI